MNTLPYCPNCGAEVESGDATCWDCGQDLGGDPGGRRSGERSREDRGTARGGRDDRRRGRGEQPPRREGRNDPDGAAPARGHDDTDRRSVLKYGAGVVGVVGLAGGGWLLYDNVLSGGGSGPKATVRGFYAAISNGNANAANSYIHPESPTGEISQSDIEGVNSITVEELELVEKTDTEARVRATLTFDTSFSDGETSEQTLVLRKSGGEWLLYE